MSATIRLAEAKDAQKWVDLLLATVGNEYPAKEVYQPEYCASQLDPASGHETWVVEEDDRLMCSVCFLKPLEPTANPVGNLGRNLFRPESYADGSAEILLRKIAELGDQRQQMIVGRVPHGDNPQQILFEQAHFCCVGYQPLKHITRARQGVLFYVHAAAPVVAARMPLAESLSQVGELANLVFESLKISNPLAVRDSATGYPLDNELQIHDATFDDFELWKMQARAANPTIEVSSGYNRGAGFLRLNSEATPRAILAQRDSKMVGGLAFFHDDQDRCVRVLETFCVDDLSLGALFNHIVRSAQEQLSAAYVEVDVIASASRLLKCAEQLGFVPIAFFPAFYGLNNRPVDTVKLVKLNMIYTLEESNLTAQAERISKVVDTNFQDQKIGVAIINLLRALPIFVGLGDGELRKIARLFTQKLFRPGERVFNRGDASSEAYIVMRGHIDICLNEESKPIATVNNGQIFGELAFLDGSPRTAMAIASQASILLVVQRSAFNDLVRREPHLGMVVMRNIAGDLSNKLRKANAVISPPKK